MFDQLYTVHKEKEDLRDMVQKINPHGLRVGIMKDWKSEWYADDSDFAIPEESNNLKIGRVKNWYTLITVKSRQQRSRKNLNFLAKKSSKEQSMKCQTRYNISRKLIS